MGIDWKAAAQRYAHKTKELAKQVPWWGWALGGVGALTLFGGARMIGGSFPMTKRDAFEAALRALYGDEAAQYTDVFIQLGQESGISPALLAALCHQESGFGKYLSPQGPGGTGDSGHGHGLFQIDDRSFGEWLNNNDWSDPLTNGRKACEILLSDRKMLQSTAYVSDQIPGDGTVTLTEHQATRRNASPGQYTDPRPLSGSALDDAMTAAYNTGIGNVIYSLAVSLPAGYTTMPTGNDGYGLYVDKALSSVSDILRNIV